MGKLHIADGLSLPLDTITQTIAILAKRRAGKSYTMRRLVEQLFKAGQQVVIVDPKGDQHGIRHSADGKSPGLSIVILGGERGDVPLEPSGGELVAKLIVEERVSVLLDVSAFRKHEVATFMTAFLEHLYRLKAREIYRTPMMLVIDEADAVAPQKPQKGEERMLGAAEDIVRRGGQRGIGCVLVTQRSAVLNKNVLTQAQMLIALRTIAPQDLAAMNAWIDVHGTPEQRKTLMESLPSLPIGDAWFWSPGWPTADGIFKRAHVLPIETFDSGKSPEPGVKPVEPKKAADVDLDALKRQMAATIDKARASDPKELQRQIAELKKQLVARPAERVEVERVVEIPVLKNGQLEAANAMLADVAKIGREFIDFANALSKTISDTASAQCKIRGKIIPKTIPTLPKLTPAQRPLTPKPSPPAGNRERGESDFHLPIGERKILTAAAQYPAGVERDQLSVLIGYKRSSRDAYVARLREKGFVEVVGQVVFATDEGVAALGPEFEPLPTGESLREYWLGKLPEGERRIFEVLIENHPSAVHRDQLDELTGYKRSSRDAYLHRLASRRLVVSVGRGEVRASDELF